MASLTTASTNVKRIVLFSILAGAMLTSFWSFKFADSVIGDMPILLWAL